MNPAKMISAWLLTTVMLLPAAAQPTRSAGWPPQLVMARYAADPADLFSRVAHPATLPGKPGWQAGGYTEKRFGLPGLNAAQAGVLSAGPGGGVGAAMSYFGSFRYQETSAAIAYGRGLGKLQLGWIGQLHLFRAAGYGKKLATDIGMAFCWPLSDRLVTGLLFLNPAVVRIKSGVQGPGLQRMGFGWLPSEEVYVGIDLIKEENRPLQVFALIRYRPKAGLTVRAGIYSDEGQLSIGVEWLRLGVRTALVFGYHPFLGVTPAAYFIYSRSEG